MRFVRSSLPDARSFSVLSTMGWDSCSGIVILGIRSAVIATNSGFGRSVTTTSIVCSSSLGPAKAVDPPASPFASSPNINNYEGAKYRVCAGFGQRMSDLPNCFARIRIGVARTLSYNSVGMRLIEGGRDWHGRGCTSWRDREGGAIDWRTTCNKKGKATSDEDHP